MKEGAKEEEEKHGNMRKEEEILQKQEVGLGDKQLMDRVTEAHSKLTSSKPIVSCGDGGEYRCSEGSMSCSTVDRERKKAKR